MPIDANDNDNETIEGASRWDNTTGDNDKAN